MNEASEKRNLSEQEKQRLVSFFEILIEIDQRISKTEDILNFIKKEEYDA